MHGRRRRCARCSTISSRNCDATRGNRWYDLTLGTARRIRKLPANVVLHGLRATFITNLVQHQVPTHEVKQLVGHTSDELVHNVYSAGVTLERLAEVVALVDYGKTVAEAVRRAES